MSGFAHLAKSLLIPLFLAALLYLVLAHALLPFIRRHRSRYAQYLPLSTPLSSTTTTTSWRTRISSALTNLFVPRRYRHQQHFDEHDADDLFDDDEGEGMVGFDPVDERRREALEQRRSMVGEERRLSRELEEGFRDESDDEEEDGRRRI